MSQELARITDSASVLSMLTAAPAGALQFPLLKIGQPMTPECKQEIIKQGEWFIGMQEKTESFMVGQSNGKPGNERVHRIKVLAGPWRPRAILLDGDTLKEQSSDFNDPVFQKIMAHKNNKGDSVKASYGSEVLLYLPPSELPEAQRINYPNGLLVTFFYKDTFRKHSFAGQFDIKEGNKIVGINYTPLVLSTEIVESKAYSWWIPKGATRLTDAVDWIETGKAMMEQNLGTFLNPDNTVAMPAEENTGPTR